MPEASGRSLGKTLGWFCVVVGVVALACGIAWSRSAGGPEAVDGLVLGGLALVAGCVILHRRRRETGSTSVS